MSDLAMKSINIPGQGRWSRLRFCDNVSKWRGTSKQQGMAFFRLETDGYCLLLTFYLL